MKPEIKEIYFELYNRLEKETGQGETGSLNALMCLREEIQSLETQKAELQKKLEVTVEALRIGLIFIQAMEAQAERTKTGDTLRKALAIIEGKDNE